MNTTTTRTTLAEFGPDSVWFTSVGIPTGIMIEFTGIVDEETGETYDMDLYDVETAIPFDWNLEGTVEGDTWTWDGEGEPNDWKFNSVLSIKAFR